jgi:hypothetical protein
LNNYNNESPIYNQKVKSLQPEFTMLRGRENPTYKRAIESLKPKLGTGISPNGRTSSLDYEHNYNKNVMDPKRFPIAQIGNHNSQVRTKRYVNNPSLSLAQTPLA